MRNAGILALGVCLLVGTAALALDSVDSKVDPSTGYIRTVTSVWNGSGYDILQTIDPGSGQSTTTTTVSGNAADDFSPRIEVAENGDVWVTWWRDLSNDQVRLRKFRAATQTWGTDRLFSDGSTNARNPEIAFDGTSSWIAYEVHGSSSRGIAVGIIADEPDPIPTATIVRTTSFTGDVDVDIHAENGHLWITWVDGSSEVGWSEYAELLEAWTEPAFASYSTSSIEAARAAIRSIVLGL